MSVYVSLFVSLSLCLFICICKAEGYQKKAGHPSSPVCLSVCLCQSINQSISLLVIFVSGHKTDDDDDDDEED